MTRSRIHPAWLVLSAVALAMMTASGIRTAFGVYVKPMEAEFGWSRAALSEVAALSLLLLGAVSPLAGRLADRWGPRRVIALSIVLLGVGTIGTAFVRELWHVYMTAGILMALGSGGAGLTTGSTVIARWFEARRGLAIGVSSAAISVGQLGIIPLAAVLTLNQGWRTSYLVLGLGLLVFVFPLVAGFLRNEPEERGLQPYGATGPLRTSIEAAALQRAGRVSLVDAARVPQLWLLMATQFVCGCTSIGMILTHFMPHALEHGFTEIQASMALGVMGAMNVVGTIASGWICDRFGRCGPLATFYLLRGMSLLLLPYVWSAPSLLVWAAIFGLNYFSTVPPTTTLTVNIFGRYSVGELSGWIFFAHQVGAALGAAIAGWVFEWSGTYTSAFVSAAVLAFLGSALTLLIREEPISSRPMAVSAAA
ncbi:MAG: MFS transporter [Candidatus Rokuibacteriota bacterium]|nr:MAG: MFS transporter [Candidatus Rokubacteria bacterium]